MAVLKEYRCQDPRCGRLFDSFVPSCIHCGTTNVKRVFLTPPGFKSDKTKLQDSSIEHLTASYHLSDFSNNQSTKHDPDRPAGAWVNTQSELGDLRTLVNDPSLALGGAKMAAPNSRMKNGSVDTRAFAGMGGDEIIANTQERGKDDRTQLETTVKAELGIKEVA